MTNRKRLPGMFALSGIFLLTPLIAADPPRFETASVKRADRCSMQNSIDPGRVSLKGDPLIAVLTEAFKVNMDQITGPSWLDSDCFEVIGRIPEGATKDQLPALLQALLVERFGLVFHKEKHQRPGYALMIEKNGPKFKESDLSSSAVRAGRVSFGFTPENTGIKGSTTLAWLSSYLSKRLGVPVEDLTGMKGMYDIDVSWAPDAAFEKFGPFPENAAASPPAGKANIFTAIRESLGLRLEPRREQVETIVIDHIERVPTEN